MNNPNSYVKHNILQRRDTDDFAIEYSDELGKMSGRCLDVGSGTADGAVDFVLPKLNPKATLVCSDISEPMVNFGKERYKDNHRVSYIKLDIQTPDLPKNLVEQFDNVTSFYCLHWCRNLRQAFENIFNLLRPGGTALLAFIATDPSLDAYIKLGAMTLYQPYMKDANRYIPVFQHAKRPRESSKALLKEIGFDVHHCSLREKSHVFKTRDELRDFYSSMNPFIDHIPSNLKEKFTGDLIEEIANEKINFKKNKNSDDEYSILAVYHVLVIYLTKPLAISSQKE